MSKNGKTIDTSFLAAGSEGLVAMPDGEAIVQVQINLEQAFEDWITNFYETAEATVAASGGQFLLTIEEFRLYVRTLIASRIDFVNSRRAIVGPTEEVRVPTFLHVTLQALGKVESEEMGVWLIPVYDETMGPLLSLDEVLSISNRLAPLEWVGYQMARGYDRDKRGAFDLMAMQFILDGVRRGVYTHDPKAQTVFAPVAYFLGLQQLQVLLGQRIKVVGDLTVKTRLRALARIDSSKRAS